MNPKKADLLYQVIYDATKEKFSFLPLLAGLMVTLVAIGVSGGLLANTIVTRGVITVLLLLMILSLQFYYSAIIELLSGAHESLYGENNPHSKLSVSQSFYYLVTGKIKDKKPEPKFMRRFSSQFPALALLCFWFIVFAIILEIWNFI